ncbi:hypothetical protein [Mongoliitalea daihaiensis]|uniref:hypothetical protein n=1 Tax=Mongoliitalea daihaiensis TaxID=2782006 RepID=UPI001F17E48A|nr:hypothetical protein [Mongoliitalea daihaiensis]UJP65974.1 hypothetical protein IPZ59_04945 [Mongoliitalea daihaiensis]
MKKTSKKERLSEEIPERPLLEDQEQDFGGFPSGISLTKNIGCASDGNPKAKEKKWKEAE